MKLSEISLGTRVSSVQTDEPPPWDAGYLGDGWKVTLRRRGRRMTVPFWKGSGHHGAAEGCVRLLVNTDVPYTDEEYDRLAAVIESIRLTDLLPFTVVGVHPDEIERSGADDATYVEWVLAFDADAAVEAAKVAAQDGSRDEALVVAVFEGHIVDKLFSTGLNMGGFIDELDGDKPPVNVSPDDANVRLHFEGVVTVRVGADPNDDEAWAEALGEAWGSVTALDVSEAANMIEHEIIEEELT